MKSDKARLSVDLTPELRRRLKTVAAQLDVSMRELALASLERQLTTVQHALESGGLPEKGPAARLSEVSESSIDSELAALHDAMSRISPALPGRLAAIRESVTRELHDHEQQALRELTSTIQSQIAEATESLHPDQASAVQRVLERAADEQRSQLQAALEELESRYRRALVEIEQRQLAAMRAELDPFARDWESEEDSIYDNVG